MEMLADEQTDTTATDNLALFHKTSLSRRKAYSMTQKFNSYQDF